MGPERLGNWSHHFLRYRNLGEEQMKQFGGMGVDEEGNKYLVFVNISLKYLVDVQVEL